MILAHTLAPAAFAKTPLKVSMFPSLPGDLISPPKFSDGFWPFQRISVMPSWRSVEGVEFPLAFGWAAYNNPLYLPPPHCKDPPEVVYQNRTYWYVRQGPGPGIGGYNGPFWRTPKSPRHNYDDQSPSFNVWFLYWTMYETPPTYTLTRKVPKRGPFLWQIINYMWWRWRGIHKPKMKGYFWSFYIYVYSMHGRATWTIGGGATTHVWKTQPVVPL